MNQIFFNQFGRLRSGWRFVLFLLAFAFFAGLLGLVIRETVLRLFVGIAENSLYPLIYPQFALLVGSIFTGWLCGKFLEGLPFRALGAWFTKNWLKDFSAGLILGAFSILFAAFLGMIFGGLRFQFNHTGGQTAILLTLGTSFTVFFIAAAAEEALFRGYIFQTFTRARLVLFGILLTSFLFATVHNGNPNANILSWLNTFLAGIWFAVAYLKTRNLWFVFGLHLAWNWLQGAILGINVSGITELTPAPLFQATDASPTWLTGGSYGLEAGIVCTIALIFSSLLIWFLPFLKPTEELLALTSEEKVSHK
jgi:membrane protease YdiL (CAAX protease family)